MTTEANAARLARAWISGWIEGRPYEIPLAPNFTHSSPFGVLEGRDRYMEFMKPVIENGSPPMEIVKVVGGDDEAAIWYTMAVQGEAIACCDWVRVERDQIVEITSFYDATKLR